MVILEEAPYATQSREVRDLRRTETVELESGTLVKAVIKFQRALHAFEVRELFDRLAVHQQLKVVHPYSSSSHQEGPEGDVASFGMQWKHDGIFRPLGRAVQIAVAHVVELKRGRVTILANPQPRETVYILCAQETAKFDLAPLKVHGDPAMYRAETTRTLFSALKSCRPAPTVTDLVVRRDRAFRRDGPPRW